MPFNLAVIPARGGSKGVPRKNLRLLVGKPLIAHTIELAQKCPSLTRTVVSTDDAEIAQVAKEFGGDVPFMRPAELANDTVAMEPGLQHAVDEVEKLDGVQVDVVVLLHSTCPLRSITCVEDAIKLQAETDADSVVSMVELGTPVYWIKKIVDGQVKPYSDDFPVIGRRQDAPTGYKWNDAVWVVKRDLLMQKGVLWGETSRALIMNPNETVDINTEWDFELAEWMMTRKLAEA